MRARDLCLSFFLLSLGTGLSACSPSIGDYPRELEEAVCKWRHECHVYERIGDCIDAEALDRDPEYDYLARAVEAGNVVYDADAAADCLDAMRERSCDYDSPEPEACGRVFRGRITANGPCLSSAECAGDAVCGFEPNCRAEDPCCVGACRVFADPLELGEACNNGSQCAPEAFCATDPVTFMPTVCTARVKAGGDCSLGEACVEGSQCDGSKCREIELRGPGEPCGGDQFVRCAEPAECNFVGDAQEPVCVVAGGLGGPCGDGQGCRRGDTFCDDVSGLCTLLPGPGQGCVNGYECLPYAECQGGYYDEYGEQMGDSVCRAKAKLGESCLPGGGGEQAIDCLGDLECDETGRCVLPPLSGQQCEIPTDDL